MDTHKDCLDSVHDPLVGRYVDSYEFAKAKEEIEQRISVLKSGDYDDFQAARDHTLSYHLNTRGFLHIQLGDYQAALDDCLEARKLNPDLDQNNLNLAHLFYHHYHQTIIPNIEKIKDQFDVMALSEIARAYHNTGFFAEAACYLNLAIAEAEQEELAPLYNDLAGAYLGTGIPIEALKASSKALSLDPSTDPQNYHLSLLQVEGLSVDSAQFCPAPIVQKQDAAQEQAFFEHDYAQALRKYEKLTQGSSQGEVDAKLPSHLLRKAMCHLNLGNYSDAIEDCLKARKLDLTIGHDDLRLCQFFEKQYDDKLKALFTELEREFSAATYNDIGHVFFEHKLYAQAITYYNLATSLAEDSMLAESYNNLAAAYFNSGFTIESMQASQKAIELDPSINRVNFNLARMKIKPMMLDATKLSVDRFVQAQQSTN